MRSARSHIFTLTPVALVVACAGLAQADIDPVWVTMTSSPVPQSLAGAVTDSTGNTYVIHNFNTGSGPGEVDMGLKRFNADGSLAWERTFAGPVDQDIVTAVTLSRDEAFVYVLGRSSVPNFGDSDFVVLKYDALAGDLLWSTFLDGGDLGIDNPQDIAATPDGGVVVVGGIDRPNEQRDFGTFKLDADGNQLWLSTLSGFGPIGFENDDARFVRVNDAGDVFITGDTRQGNNYDVFTIRYEGATGAEVWRAQYVTSASDNARDLEIAPDGNIVLLVQDPFGIDRQWGFAKYDAETGATLWEARVDPGQDEHIRDLFVASDGTVYATGATDPDFDDGNSNENLILVSYDGKTGLRNWILEFGDLGAGDYDLGNHIAEAGDGAIYVAGYTRSDAIVGGPFDSDALLLEVDALTGDVSAIGLLDTTVPGGEIQGESFYRLGKDNQGRLYASGTVAGETSANGLPEILIAQYSPGVTTRCLPDTNGDGILSPTDFNAWINAFNNNLPACDQNQDGACTPSDFNAWIANYNAGC